MLVGERMSHPVITVRKDIPIQDALNKMKVEGVRRFPVVDRRGHMIGLVSENDILHATPSEATTLSIWEINYLLSKVTVERVMVKNIITVTPDTPLEEAARIMADNNVSGLPVTRDNELVGIITETDLFKIFLEMLGARDPGIRLSALIPNEPGELAKITKATFDVGGNIIALGTFLGESSETSYITLKVEGVEAEALQKAVEPFVKKVVDIR
jgi:acetoin utilization protein AcuB